MFKKILTASCIVLYTCAANQETFLVFGGKTGWIGQQLVALIEKNGDRAVCALSRLEDRNAIAQEIARVRPTRIINAAGVTGVPNVDWCEDHKIETLRANVLGALTIADVAAQRNLHVTYIGTGCIYEYDKTHAMGSGIGFTEQDDPNFTGSFYSYTKGLMQKLLTCYKNVLILRVRMPISADLHPRNFITKILHYKKVVNVPNSMTILDDMLPVAIDMAKKQYTGTYNFVNPGVISHNEILDLYKKYVDPNFVYQNFTIEEQNQILKAKRSNNELDAHKLCALYPNIPDIKTSMVRVFERMKARLVTTS